MKATIGLCTYNRADLLREALTALDGQDLSPDEAEVLVVDNGSRDATEAVVEDHRQRARLPVRYVLEPRRGLSHARNRCLERARGELVLFIDDDAVPVQPDWARRLCGAFVHADVAAAGGDVIPEWPDGVRPAWLHESLVPPLGLTPFRSQEPAELCYPRSVVGANCCFRRVLSLEMGGFEPALGFSGDTLVPGEETELCLRLWKAGKKTLYIPGAAVRHRIARAKLTSAWIQERARGQGISEAMIDRLHLSRFDQRWALCSKLFSLPMHTVGWLAFRFAEERRLQGYYRYRLEAAQAYASHYLGWGP